MDVKQLPSTAARVRSWGAFRLPSTLFGRSSILALSSGLILFLGSFVPCPASPYFPPVSEAKTHFDQSGLPFSSATHHGQPDRTDDLPLLFLTLLGLGMLTLSETKPSKEHAKKVVDLSAGKKGARGQDLPHPQAKAELATR